MKTNFRKLLSVFLCLILTFSMCLISSTYSNCKAVDSDGEADQDFCKIKRSTATVTINPFEKVKLYADYSIHSVGDYELVWSINGKSYFLNGYQDKTTGSETELLFFDDTTVKLQIISSNGEVLCEDEVLLKSYIDKDRSFWLNLQSYILLPIIVFVGVVGGTAGPWIGKVLNLLK